jgi:uncharacterized Ntn-hydrolase superfamily protein
MLSREDPKNLLTIDNDVTVILQNNLAKLGIYKGAITGVLNDETSKALNKFVNIHNFENRMHEERHIWKNILDYMSELASKA